MKKLLLALILTVTCNSLLFAADVTVAWDANDPAPAGYGIYWDTVNEMPFNNMADVPTGTRHTIPGLIENTTYFFAVDAYDVDGNRSSYSNILEYVVEAEQVVIRVIDRPKGIQIIWE